MNLGDAQRAIDYDEQSLEVKRKIGHPNVEKYAAYLEDLWMEVRKRG